MLMPFGLKMCELRFLVCSVNFRKLILLKKKSYFLSLLQAHELLKQKNLEKEESRFVHVAIVCQICFASGS